MTPPHMSPATIIGAGLAGCEAAFQLAERGVEVVLVDQKPHKRTPAHASCGLAELVCSNSMRAASLGNAVGLLKEELRRAGSIVMKAADATRVPAGGALAVDRERFSANVTAAIAGHPRIRVRSEEILAIPESRPVILATGPLTGDALAADLARVVGAEQLSYYDAIAPVVAAEGIDRGTVFLQSRYDKGDEQEGAYLNCPFDEAGYRAFVASLLAAEKVAPRSFEDVRYFEGCLPVEVMAERGEMTLAFGPMKPVGLTDPRTGRRPFAVVQLRAENADRSAYNLVGFQTRMTHAAQARVLRTIPGLERADVLRFGSVHRNTFVSAPEALDQTMQLLRAPGVFVAGQLSGVEGYVESAAGGLLCAIMLAQRLSGREVLPPPGTTALGGLLSHLRRDGPYQPSNITWAHLVPIVGTRKKKRERYAAMADRALADLEPWLGQIRAAAPGSE